MLISKFEAHAYAIMRIIVGFLFLCHGSQKLFGFPPAGHEMSAFIVWVAGSIEFFGGLFIFLGLFTHYAAFIASGEMAFAYWIGHGTYDVLPISNHGELAMIYCFIFLFISIHGSGILGIDYFMKKKNNN